MPKNNFNLVIVGIGGQGQLTLLRILAEAAFFEKKEIKTSELHGLSQRGGSVEVQIRFGKNIFSPLVFQAGADLILSLEMHEALRALYYSSEKTKFLINKNSISIPGQNPIPEKKILREIKKFTKNVELVNASEICKKEFGNEILAGVYLLGYALNKKMIPLKKESVLAAIKKLIPEKYLEMNLRAFNLAS